MDWKLGQRGVGSCVIASVFGPRGVMLPHSRLITKILFDAMTSAELLAVELIKKLAVVH
jgi:hypothetical protein